MVVHGLHKMILQLGQRCDGDRGLLLAVNPSRRGSLAILICPALLGGFADKIGLHLAHLIVPGLVAVALICFVVGQALQRQTELRQSS